MKIALIGASGFVGSALREEALKRGHAVTALANRPERLHPTVNLTIAKADVMDSAALAKQLRGQDALLSAFSGHASSDIYGYYMKGLRAIVAAVKVAGVPRFLLVGGAGSLEVAPGKLLIDTPEFPDAWKATGKGALDALTLLRAEHELNWTVLSPAADMFRASVRASSGSAVTSCWSIPRARAASRCRTTRQSCWMRWKRLSTCVNASALPTDPAPHLLATRRTPMNETFHMQYIFDPLCGWCYASAPALAALVMTWPERVELMPSGLFSADGGRAMTPEWADHAWTNDQRIATLTRQIFSEAYHRQVLSGQGVRFDSTTLNRALTALRVEAPKLESNLLHELQAARYVEGRDTSRVDVVADVTAAFGARHGLGWRAPAMAERLRDDTALHMATDARIRDTQALMHRLNIHGVPQLLVWSDDDVSVFHGASLYQGADKLMAEIHDWTAVALPPS